MQYRDLVPATFLRRLNRFLCEVTVDGQTVPCHVPNTSRLTELLVPGCNIVLTRNADPRRKTRYTMIHMDKGGYWINIDSQVPNRIVWDAVAKEPGLLGLTAAPDEISWRREYTYGHSRFDLSYRTGEQMGLVEIKGVTLEENGIACFPGAPTTRGVRHLNELAAAALEGWRAHLVFCVQIPYAVEVRIARHIDSAFGAAHDAAKAAGVSVHAFRCAISPGEVYLTDAIPFE